MSRMGQGKAPYNVAKRSVIRPIGREWRAGMGDGIGQTSAGICVEEGELVTASACYVMDGQAEDAVSYAFWQVENEILAAGGELNGVRPVFLFPDAEEETLAAVWGKTLDGLCRERKCQVLGVGAAGSGKVGAPVCMMIGYGMRKRRCLQVKAGQDLVAVGHIGMEGIAMLARGRQEELKRRFAFDFIGQAASFFEELSMERMVSGLDPERPVFLHALGEGGILAGLWNLAERTGLGLCVQLKEIPVRQETVEICEFFGLNPYQMMSGGMALAVTEHGEELAGRMRRMGFSSRVIGTMTDENQRVVENDGDRRFLDRPAVDEIYKTGILV